MGDPVDDLLEFWFARATTSPAELAARHPYWFRRHADFDRLIARRYTQLVARAAGGELDAWSAQPRSALALVILLDQFPRNLFRERAEAFTTDPKARAVALAAIAAGFDHTLHPLEAVFIYLPLEHAEDLALQDRSVELFECLRRRAPPGYEQAFDNFLDYAHRHREVIRRFGRFPHRNAVLDRTSTADEVHYLEHGGETFSGSASEHDH